MQEERGTGRRCSTIAHVNSLDFQAGPVLSRRDNVGISETSTPCHAMPKIDDSKVASRAIVESKLEKPSPGNRKGRRAKVKRFRYRNTTVSIAAIRDTSAFPFIV